MGSDAQRRTQETSITEELTLHPDCHMPGVPRDHITLSVYRVFNYWDEFGPTRC